MSLILAIMMGGGWPTIKPGIKNGGGEGGGG